MGFSTDAIHFAQEPEESTGAIIPPIHLSTIFEQEDIGVNKGFGYSRTDNPTRRIYEQVLAKLEKGAYCLSFSSGVAAISSLMALLRPNDEIISCKDIYGGALKIFEKVFPEYLIKTKYFDIENIESVRNLATDKTKILYVESPTNPLLKLLSIKKAAQLAKELGLLLAVDNTFMTPYLQNPLEHGADIVIHSSTKYLGGHSDVVGGAIIVNDKSLYNKFRFYRTSTGAVPSAFDSWLLLRSIKTLSIRMETHCKNAEKFYRFAKENLKLKKVFYPLNNVDNPHYKEAISQMKGYGGIVSIDFEDENLARRILKNLKLFTLAESLGGVESLVNQPYSMTHGSFDDEFKKSIGITKSLLRFSIGIEDIEDLIEDFEQAYKKSLSQ